MSHYDNKLPKEALALGMFRSKICRVWGHAAVFARSDLIFDRSRKLVGLQPTAACATRAGGSGLSGWTSPPQKKFLRSLNLIAQRKALVRWIRLVA